MLTAARFQRTFLASNIFLAWHDAIRGEFRSPAFIVSILFWLILLLGREKVTKFPLHSAELLLTKKEGQIARVALVRLRHS